MTFNYTSEKRKFDNAWAKLAQTYAEAGMTPEAIQEMYEYDWGVFKANRIEALHSQGITVPEVDYEEYEYPLVERLWDNFVNDYDTLGGHSRYWWLEELSNPCLVIGVPLLSHDDKEILTMYIIDRLTIREIAQRLGRKKSSVSERLQKIFALFPTAP